MEVESGKWKVESYPSHLWCVFPTFNFLLCSLCLISLLATTSLLAQETEIRIAPLQGDPAAAKLALADSLFARQMFDLAIAEYNNFLKDFPKATGRDAALFRLAESYRQSNNTANAQTTYERLVKEFNKGEFYSAGSYRLGEIYLAAGKFEPALKMLQTAASGATSDTVKLSALFHSGRALDRLGRDKEAIETFRKVSAAQGDNPFRNFTNLALADALSRTGAPAEALPLYEKIAAEAPEMRTEALVKAGVIAAQLGEPVRAEKFLVEALKQPDIGAQRATVIITRMRLAAAAKRYADLIAVPETDLKLLTAEQRAQALAFIAEAYRQTGDKEKAKTFYNRLAKEHHNSPTEKANRYNRVLVLAATNDPSATAELETFIAQASAGAERDNATLLLADRFRQANDLARAIPLYEKIAASSHFNKATQIQILNTLAWAYRTTGAFDKAIEIYTKLLADPDLEKNMMAAQASTPAANSVESPTPSIHARASILLARANTFLAAKKYDEALTDSQTIIADFPQAPERETAMLNRAIALGEKQNAPAMAEAFKQLLAAYPKTAAAAQAEFWIGHTLYVEKKYAEALPHLIRARELDATNYGSRATPLITLCYYYLENRIALAREVATQKPAEVPTEILRWLGLHSAQDRDYPTAVRTLRDLIALGNKEPDVLITFAESLVTLTESQIIREQATPESYNEVTAAARNTLDTVKSNPSIQARAYIVLSRANRALGNFDEAAEEADEAMRLQPEGAINASARMAAAEVHFARGNFDEAARSFMSVSLLNSDPAIVSQALRRAADAYRRTNDETGLERVRTELRKLNIDPE